MRTNEKNTARHRNEWDMTFTTRGLIGTGCAVKSLASVYRQFRVHVHLAASTATAGILIKSRNSTRKHDCTEERAIVDSAENAVMSLKQDGVCSTGSNSRNRIQDSSIRQSSLHILCKLLSSSEWYVQFCQQYFSYTCTLCMHCMLVCSGASITSICVHNTYH